jgi:16S rRNA (guanine1207-N2)-methyltransferase
VETARRNAERNGVGGVSIFLSDGFTDVDASGFDMILSNPPYQTDFSVAKGFIEKGFNRLKIGGKLYMVTKRREWYKNKIISVFGGVEIHETDGYFVFIAQRRSLKYANKSPKRH